MTWQTQLQKTKENQTTKPRASGINYLCKGTSIGDGGSNESRDRGVQETWQSSWDSQKSSLKSWKKSVSKWKSQLSGKLAAERLLAQLRLNRHPMLQPLPGKQQPQCGCNRAKLTATHFVNGCSLWTRQRSTLLNEVRATLQNPELPATSLLDTLLREHTNAFTEWKMSDALWQYYSTTMG